MKWSLYPAGRFDGFAERWSQLNRETLNTPLLALDFVAPLLTEFGTGHEKLAICEQDGKTLAMTIIAPRGRGVWDTFQPSQAPIGLWLHRSGLNVEKLSAALLKCLPGLSLSLGLTQIDPDLLARPKDSSHLRTVDYIETAKITINGSFDDYWNARGKNLRANMKKQRSKLQKDGVQTRMQINRAPEDVAAAIADYGRLESAGWKAAGGTAIHPDNAQGRYYQRMLESFCRRGAACIYRYWFDAQLVAMDLCIEGPDCIIILKTTYDETVPNSLSPTLLMREEACRQWFDEARFKKIEFYGKVMEWHRRWSDEIRTMYHITEYRWPFLLDLRNILKASKGAANQLSTQVPSTPNSEPSTE
jgi:CelD/BcsL family acetyltransferase involved in cellulose biosynthesis